MTRWERIKYSMCVPTTTRRRRRPGDPPVDEIEAEIRRSNDKERTIGLVAARSLQSSGWSSARRHQLRPRPQPERVRLQGAHVRPSGPRRPDPAHVVAPQAPVQGITLALYGLAIFQLHYTYVGFAAPSCSPAPGTWCGYRLQQELKRAEAAGPGAPRPKSSPGAARRALAATSATRRPPDPSLTRSPTGARAARLRWLRTGPSADVGEPLSAALRERPAGPPKRWPDAGGAAAGAPPRATAGLPPGPPAARTRWPTSARWRRWRPVTPGRDPGTAMAATVEPGRWNESPGSCSP